MIMAGPGSWWRSCPQASATEPWPCGYSSAFPLLQVGNNGTQLIDLVEQLRYCPIAHWIDAVQNDPCSNEITLMCFLDHYLEDGRHLGLQHGRYSATFLPLGLPAGLPDCPG